MDAEGEIEHRGPCGQDPELTGRRENEDFLGRRLRKVLGAVGIGMLQGVADGSQPLVHRLLPLDALVGPVRGEAVLRDVVHAAGADLDLDIGPVTVLDRDVEGFVAVGLGVRDPVAQALGVLLVFLGNEGEDLPAELPLQLGIVLGAVDDEADGEHVEDALEGDVLLDHLGPDGVGGLRADLQLVGDAGVGELFLQRFDKFRHQFFPVLLSRL